MIRKSLERTVSVLRDGWLVLGISLCLLLLLEAAYRGQANFRRMIRSIGEPTVERPEHPYASEAWWAEWRSGEGGWQNRYDPYRARWPLPKTGLHLNIDSAGRRLTVQPSLDHGSPRVRIYLLGGSTMFGYTSRDSWTIPSQLAALIAEDGGSGVEVVNLAQSTFNVTQGAVTLMLELRDGRVPDAVAFLDGNNEIAPVFQGEAAGDILNQTLIARERDRRPSTANELTGVFSFVERLGRLFRPPVEPLSLSSPEPIEACPAVVDTYFGTIAAIDALAEAYGFEALYFWQPMLATTGKDLTDFERSERTSEEWRSMVVECSNLANAEAARLGVDRFQPLTHLFDDWGDTVSVFLDDYGHVTEAGNRRIAMAILAELDSVLRPER